MNRAAALLERLQRELAEAAEALLLQCRDDRDWSSASDRLFEAVSLYLFAQRPAAGETK